MKQGSTIFLKGVIILIGLAILAICVLVLPRALMIEDDMEYRLIILGMIIASIPFFFALYQTLKLLNYIDKSKAFSELSVRSLNYIKYSAVTIGILFTAEIPFFYLIAEEDDAPGLVIIGMILAGAPIVIATLAAVLQKILQNAIDIKSENDLTV